MFDTQIRNAWDAYKDIIEQDRSRYLSLIEKEEKERGDAIKAISEME